jgi:hypothetical protein
LKKPKMTDLSPEALTEGPLRHKQDAENEMTGIPANARVDVEQ